MAREKLQTVDSGPREEPAARQSQLKQPPSGRFQLQVDRQTKGFYTTMEAAETAGRAIKKGHPIVQVSIYDPQESTNTLIENPAG